MTTTNNNQLRYAVLTADQYDGLDPYNIKDLIVEEDRYDDNYDLSDLLIDRQCDYKKIDNDTYLVIDMYGYITYYIDMTDNDQLHE